ncbi:MarR family winged helix-turn-helix transcriptional regulator [Streptomyces sp. NPDC046332]|uniref:MarR family winged helix-turn-helix transcriptional regulator n=1 Tax=Streptomyces sp. NPDC046332 TaxID=3155133 RepID=UPI0034042030
MTTPAIRATLPTVEVLSLLLEASADDPPWATKVSERAGLGKSTVSQILARLVALTWVELREEQGPHPGRPPRVFCTLTREGRRQAEEVLTAKSARRQRCPEKPARTATTHGNLTRNDCRPGQPDTNASRASGKEIHQQNPGPRMRGHWPIDFSSLKRHVAAATVSHEEQRNVAPESEPAVQLNALREAHRTLQLVNRNLTKEFLIRSAVASTHRTGHEEVVRDILMEATDIRDKALRAQNY